MLVHRRCCDDLMEAGVLPSRPLIERVEGEVMAVNSFVVHGPNGLVVVDGQLTVPDADQVRRVTDQAAEPVAGLLVTHPHPDHYAGAARLLDGLDVPIVATAAVDAVIRRDDAEKDAIVGPMMGEAWPQSRRFPDAIVDSGSDVELAGLTFNVRDIGPGESDADSLWVFDGRTVFAGDVAYNDMHAYLADGRYIEWVAALDRLGNELPADATLYLGHGAPDRHRRVAVAAQVRRGVRRRRHERIRSRRRDAAQGSGRRDARDRAG